MPSTPADQATPTDTDFASVTSAIVSAVLVLLCALLVLALGPRHTQPVLQVVASSEPIALPAAPAPIVAEPPVDDVTIDGLPIPQR